MWPHVVPHFGNLSHLLILASVEVAIVSLMWSFQIDLTSYIIGIYCFRASPTSFYSFYFSYFSPAELIPAMRHTTPAQTTGAHNDWFRNWPKQSHFARDFWGRAIGFLLL